MSIKKKRSLHPELSIPSFKEMPRNQHAAFIELRALCGYLAWTPLSPSLGNQQLTSGFLPNLSQVSWFVQSHPLLLHIATLTQLEKGNNRLYETLAHTCIIKHTHLAALRHIGCYSLNYDSDDRGIIARKLTLKSGRFCAIAQLMCDK
ncbi:hypothetical protein FKM82_005329 [Ascaphus truei]